MTQKTSLRVPRADTGIVGIFHPPRRMQRAILLSLRVVHRALKNKHSRSPLLEARMKNVSRTNKQSYG